MTTVLHDHAFIKKVLAIALPIMLHQVLSGSVNLIDNLMVGQLGEIAIAAASTSNKFLSIGLAAMMGLVNGTMIFLAQYVGAKKEDEVADCMAFALKTSLIVMGPFSLACIFSPSLVTTFFNNSSELIFQAGTYLPWAGLAMVVMALSFPLQASLRAMGHTTLPLLAAILSMITNISLNCLLIFGYWGFPRLGLVGAGIATLIARILELIFLLLVMRNLPGPCQLFWSRLAKSNKSLIKAILLKSGPLLLNEFLWALGMATLYKFYGTRGLEVLSAHTIQQSLGDLFYILFGGMAAATTILVGHPLGANQLDLAKKQAYKLLQLAMVLALIFSAGMFSASFLIPHLYQASPQVLTMAQTIMRLSSGLFWIYMFNAQCYFIIRAGGDVKSSLFMDAGYMWCVNLVVVGFFAYMTPFSFYVVFLAGQFTDFLKLFFTYRLLRKEKWVHNLIENDLR